MSEKSIRDIAARIASWPETAQEEAIRALLAIEEKHGLPTALDDETRRAVREGLAQASKGDFASDTEVRAVFRRR